MNNGVFMYSVSKNFSSVACFSRVLFNEKMMCIVWPFSSWYNCRTYCVFFELKESTLKHIGFGWNDDLTYTRISGLTASANQWTAYRLFIEMHTEITWWGRGSIKECYTSKEVSHSPATVNRQQAVLFISVSFLLHPRGFEAPQLKLSPCRQQSFLL